MIEQFDFISRATHYALVSSNSYLESGIWYLVSRNAPNPSTLTLAPTRHARPIKDLLKPATTLYYTLLWLLYHQACHN